MSQRSGNGQGSPTDLTSAVLVARSGLRRDVQLLLDRLDIGELFTPLAHQLSDVPEGELVELTDDISIVPHMLVDEEGDLFCALFTRPEFIEPLASQLGWNTDGGPLQYVAFPARIALDMTVDVIDEKSVLGVVINAGDSSELLLRRSEVGALLHGKAVPLVGYLDKIPDGAEEDTLVAESSAPASTELIRIIEECIEKEPLVTSFRLARTFNPERDLEPHLTLYLATGEGDVDRADLVAAILDAIKDRLPPPGYIDIVFED